MSETEIVTNIYPLSATEKLSGRRMEIYSDTLRKAIMDPDICNIAITGDTGIGKSSVIRTYLKDSSHRFASLSLAEYTTEYQRIVNDDAVKRNQNEDKVIEHVCVYQNITNCGDNGTKEASKEKLEKSMLRQILSLCRKKDIPSSVMELIPEERFRHKAFLTGLIIAAYALMWLIKLNSKRASEIIHTVLQNIGSLAVGRICLDVSIAIVSACLIAFIVYKIITRLHIKEVSAELGNQNIKVGAAAESVKTFSLEKYRMELTYVFEKISKQYNAIVFEDMDRIDDAPAIEILTYLREINTAVNERLKNGNRSPGKIRRNVNEFFEKQTRKFFSDRFIRKVKDRYFRIFKRKLCFIFVINEDMVSKFDYHKYIDFGLSIIPTLSQSNAMDSVDLLLKNLPGFNGESVYDATNLKYKNSLVKWFAEIPELCDFRRIFQIKNEYTTFYNSLLYSKNTVTALLPECNEKTLLSFIIYKNLLPGDYARIRQGTSYIFQISLPTKDKNGNPINTKQCEFNNKIKTFLEETLTISLESTSPILGCYLSFVGFSETRKRGKYSDTLTDKSLSASKKSVFFNEDIRDECLAIKIFMDTDNKSKQRDICYKIEDLFLKYFLNEYIEVRYRSSKVNAIGINQAEANIKYFTELIYNDQRSVPSTDRDALDKNFYELKTFMDKKAKLIHNRNILYQINRYYEAMGHGAFKHRYLAQ